MQKPIDYFCCALAGQQALDVLAQALCQRGGGQFDTGSPQLAQVVNSVAQEGGCFGVGREMLVDRKFFYAQIDFEDIGNDAVVVTGFDDLGACSAEYPATGGLALSRAQNQCSQVSGQNGLLQEVAPADELQRLAGAEFGDELWVAAVQGQAAQLRTRAVDMAGPQDGPGHGSSISVDEF